jgi:hypothetical protein
MVVDDLDIVNRSLVPDKADTILIIDPYAMLPFSVA